MNAELELRRALHDEFSSARIKNPMFSLRAFARKLNLPPSALSEILNGKRTVLDAIAQRLQEKEVVSGDEIKQLAL